MSYSMFGRWAEARNIALRGALVFIALLSAANAATFTAQDASPITCAGNLTIEKGGVVRCSDGASLLQSCSGDVVIDTKGVIRCPAAVGLPVCTLAAAPSSITLGASSLLTATCNPLASSYVWTGVPTSFGSGASGLVYPTATTTYTVKGVSSTGQQGVAASKTVTVTTSSTAPTSPPSCSLSQQQPGPYPGTAYLVSSCNPAATSYGWSSNAMYNSSACSTSQSNCVVPSTSSATYSMTGSNAMGSGNTASITVVPTASCTLSASPSTVLQGGSSTLTATCSPAAESYSWSALCNADADANDNACTVTPTGTTDYSVVGNVAGVGATSPASARVTVTLPSCTLIASKATIGSGDSSTLTASCNPAATGYTWTGGTCVDNTTGTCTVTPADTTPYTVTGTGANTSSATTSVTVLPPYCTLTADKTTISPDGTAVLAANCSPAATGYTWIGGTCDIADNNTCSVSPDVSTDYRVTGTGANTATSPILRVTVSTTPAGCSIAPVSWASGLAAYPGGTPVQTINGGEMKAWSMTQTSHPASTVRLSYSLCSTDLSISETACEWGTPDLIAKNCTVANRTDPKIVNQTSDQPPLEGKCVLDAGKTYYFNVRPVSSTVSNCTFYLSY